MAKPLTLLIHQKAKLEWTPVHTAFLTHLRSQQHKYLSCATQIQQNNTESTLIHEMMYVEHTCHKKMMEWSSP